MEYPINEQRVIEAFKVHTGNGEVPLTQSEEEFIILLVKILNKTYADGVRDGLKTNVS